MVGACREVRVGVSVKVYDGVWKGVGCLIASCAGIDLTARAAGRIVGLTILRQLVADIVVSIAATLRCAFIVARALYAIVALAVLPLATPVLLGLPFLPARLPVCWSLAIPLILARAPIRIALPLIIAPLISTC